MNNQHPTPRRHRQAAGNSGWQNAILNFAESYGWWRVFAIPVLAVITVWVFVDVFSPDPHPGEAITQGASSQAAGENAASSSAGAGAEHTSANGDDEAHKVGPDPAQIDAAAGAALDALPAGGNFTEKGDGTFREVGRRGLEVGEGKEKTVRYSVEVENGIDTSTYGGDDAFASVIDATLSDPRSWTRNGEFKFIHVGADEKPDTRIRLTSLRTTAELCGAALETETSCHTTVTGESTVLLNEARWVRGAAPYEGDLGNYRQYLLNHEFGHAIGYADHQPCGGQGKLAPIMMQQTLSLNNAQLHAKNPNEVYPDQDVTCEPNPWPYPLAASVDHINPEAGDAKPAN